MIGGFSPEGLPEAFLTRMEQMLGEEYPDFLSHFSLGERHYGLRANSLKIGPADFAAALGERFHLSPIPWCGAGFTYDPETRPGRSVFHEAGLYYIQEPSAMSAAEALLIPEGTGFRVLDLCAAPGGKSTQLAAKMAGRGLLVSNEIVPGRAKILSQNLERMGAANAVVLNESPERLAAFFPGSFDRVLVDAPCSGEGMYRKNEIALTEWSEANVRRCAARQDGILDCAAHLLAPGGEMVYSTCTFSPDEDEDCIRRFLIRHPDFTLLEAPIRPFFSPGRPDFTEDPEEADKMGIEKAVRVWPHRVNGEGHFIARLQKSPAAPDLSPVFPALEMGSGAALPDGQAALFAAFCREALTPEAEGWLEAGAFTLFGDTLYRTPLNALPTGKLKVERAGLMVGSFKKNRFEPAHALALALPAGGFRQIAALPEEEAARYLRGEALPAEEGEKGWMPAAVELGGRLYPLGWCKSDGRSRKNHYPKGLRKAGG